jgi:uncharacterized protein YdbL (DUF1318 family)
MKYLLNTFLLFFITCSLQAKSLQSIKQDMTSRLPKITLLKAEGQVGENNQGYLELKGSLNSTQEKMVRDENKDRETVYNAIADKVKESPSKIGSKRANQIRDTSPKGFWIQMPNGTWIRK